MRPYLFDLVIAGQHLKPPTYGFLMAVAFTLGYIEALRLSSKIKDGPRHVENIFLIVVLSSVVGARMFHVLFEDPGFYFKDPIQIFYVWNGGYTLYGALLLAIFSGWLYTKIAKVSFFDFADIAGPTVALGIGIGRLGCFFAGCCWGDPTDLPWGVVFDHPEAFTTNKQVAVHPTQLYEAFSCLALYVYLRWRYLNKAYLGQPFLHFLIGYSVVRFVIEMFRGDEYRGYVFGGLLSTSQFISLVIIGLTVVAMFLYSRNRLKNTQR